MMIEALFSMPSDYVAIVPGRDDTGCRVFLIDAFLDGASAIVGEYLIAREARRASLDWRDDGLLVVDLLEEP